MRELVLATVVAELKNAFVDEISDPELIELLYRGVAEPLGIKLSKVQRGTASKIVNRAPQGNPLRIIKGHSQDSEVKSSIGSLFKKNITRHFMLGMEEEIIFHFRGDIKADDKISDSKKDELLRLGKKETFDEFLGQVYLYSLTRDNVLTPEAKAKLDTELEEYKRYPLENAEIPETIIKEEHEYTSALAAVYAQVENMTAFFSNEMIKDCAYTGKPESYLSINTADVVVGGRHKKNQGKGYRAFLNTIMLFNLMKYLESSGKYASHMLILDSPILSLKEKKHKLTAEDITTVGMRESLIQYIIDNCGDNQVIIAENELPETLDYSNTNQINFSMDEEGDNRYGFLHSVRNPEEE